MDIFKKASKGKLRFFTERGTLCVEDLWDLPLDGEGSLDSLARSLNKSIKESEEESFVKTSKVSPKLVLSFDIVKSIIATKIEDAENSEKRLLAKAKKEKLLEIISRKKDEDLEGKSVEELTAELEGLLEE